AQSKDWAFLRLKIMFALRSNESRWSASPAVHTKPELKDSGFLHPYVQTKCEVLSFCVSFGGKLF
ncbi:hypothetical protein, partial [Photobacterium ganghwense]|uniref:hypothetical protein n=1 Tax=Photobacterium ganghwense TaxID=320778 RepID=UPI001C2D8617